MMVTLNLQMQQYIQNCSIENDPDSSSYNHEEVTHTPRALVVEEADH